MLAKVGSFWLKRARSGQNQNWYHGEEYLLQCKGSLKYFKSTQAYLPVYLNQRWTYSPQVNLTMHNFRGNSLWQPPLSQQCFQVDSLHQQSVIQKCWCIFLWLSLWDSEWSASELAAFESVVCNSVVSDPAVFSQQPLSQQLWVRSFWLSSSSWWPSGFRS